MKQNQLYPVFLKLDKMETLIVGGGNVALEKLQFILRSSPQARITLVAPEFRDETLEWARKFNLKIIRDHYYPLYLKEKQLVIATTDQPEVNKKVYNDCRRLGIWVNVADNPPLCDFYMGGIVTRGNLKIAISTNGQSPTVAKRLRQFFEQILPDDIDELIRNLHEYRDTLKADFAFRVAELNRITKSLTAK
ncbi:precorrin-2 dehydrogenase/sirohydrochlorin ferrochelatase family protein [Robertkochia aurantiaca]|uniref:precorrin-2 dehydrogenase/sirohydrochlorin ferrochelatase family protein n=1 Tax=Robertkochia aurantiaca TaxID=2873700 RepID=UPI001CCE4C05|nr:bifunctional precorrin-2 dehydrogenase/sirohydrochlorin ferrochelatase [Robertkochia sp. 3YJGBD-33]